MFIDSCVSLVASWQGSCRGLVLPGELAAHKIVSSVMDAMLKRDESSTVGNKKAPGCNVLKQRISTDQHQTIRKCREYTQKFTAEARGPQLPIKVIQQGDCSLPLQTVSFCPWEPSLGCFVGSILPRNAAGRQISPNGTITVENSVVGAVQQFD